MKLIVELMLQSGAVCEAVEYLQGSRAAIHGGKQLALLTSKSGRRSGEMGMSCSEMSPERPPASQNFLEIPAGVGQARGAAFDAEETKCARVKLR